MRKVYIVLTYTGTWLSRLVKAYTKNEFSHVSISLDSKLNDMYSFGRIHAYNPFSAGFVHEYVHSGTFKRFKKTRTRIYSILVTDEQYDTLKHVINEIKTENSIKSYHFNLLGLIAIAINVKIRRERHFYCAEFVKYVLDESKVKIKLPELIKPEDFKYLDNAIVEFSGFLRDYESI